MTRRARGYMLDMEDSSAMSRAIYVPIADSFFESSIMREEVTVRFVMLALIRLALRAGADGEVDIDMKMFALSLNLPESDVEAAINRLMEPDPASSCQDEDGRRIVPVDPSRPFRNWRLVNWSKYRHIVKLANDAARKRKDRHDAKDNTDSSENVLKRPIASANGATKYEVRNTNNEERVERVRFAPPSLEEVKEYGKEIPGLDATAFFDFYASKGWKVGTAPMKDWRAAARGWRRRDAESGKISTKVEARKSKEDEAYEALERRRAEVAAEMKESLEMRRKAGLST